ncbi:SGNH/GDSL hydrolase family protein [Novosphingobium sp.]|uniref:SGNH/GDSL hydrolase family protein n=1 Tax=Novosphingobium sp. TaxID=1874826 RepID=UPI0026174C98|nr:SGNH/GDSL hydrolase family protein [Novosphingobium sp.]
MRRALAALVACAMLAGGTAAEARSVLFVGNSFTYGFGSPIRRFHPERVTDLNREGVGGVPALFRTFVDQAGGGWEVSLETAGGQDLAFHLEKRASLIDRPWDVVVLQGHSVLDPARPGDPARHIAAARGLADLVTRANPKVRVLLVTTWPRADLTWQPGSPWSGKPLAALPEVVDAANRQIVAGRAGMGPPVPVGRAWLQAIEQGLADPNPYDGVAYGQVNLWTWDSYHASTEGCYLEALVLFGTLTGIDPRTLGAGERAAEELGMNPAVVVRLQQAAASALGLPPPPGGLPVRKVPEPPRRPTG